ncbi:MAG TPA: hypothetical protein VIM85_10040 [Pseudomonadales bacterium]
MVDDSKSKEQLLEKRDELKNRLEAIKADYAQGLDADFEEQAQELQNAEVLAEISRVTLQELEDIEKLLSEKF